MNTHLVFRILMSIILSISFTIYAIIYNNHADTYTKIDIGIPNIPGPLDDGYWEWDAVKDKWLPRYYSRPANVRNKPIRPTHFPDDMDDTEIEDYIEENYGL